MPLEVTAGPELLFPDLLFGLFEGLSYCSFVFLSSEEVYSTFLSSDSFSQVFFATMNVFPTYYD